MTLNTSSHSLHQAVQEVAAAVSESLKHIGFRNIDEPQGQAIYIDRHDFPSARE